MKDKRLRKALKEAGILRENPDYDSVLNPFAKNLYAEDIDRIKEHIYGLMEYLGIEEDFDHVGTRFKEKEK